MNIRLLFVVLIMIVDFIYIYFSQNFNNKVFDTLNTTKLSRTRQLTGATLAYTFMAIGWYFLVATKIEGLVKEFPGKSPLLLGAWCGFLYAALVYGVYDFTMYASVEKWKHPFITRDLIWGFSSSILWSMLYAYVVKK